MLKFFGVSDKHEPNCEGPKVLQRHFWAFMTNNRPSRSPSNYTETLENTQKQHWNFETIPSYLHKAATLPILTSHASLMTADSDLGQTPERRQMSISKFLSLNSEVTNKNHVLKYCSNAQTSAVFVVKASANSFDLSVSSPHSSAAKTKPDHKFLMFI